MALFPMLVRGLVSKTSDFVCAGSIPVSVITTLFRKKCDQKLFFIFFNNKVLLILLFFQEK